MTTDDSHIVYDREGKVCAYVGPDATNLFRAKVLKVSLGMYQFGIIPTRGMTLTKALKMATTYTGRTYKRTEWRSAQNDLQVWIATMTCALPIEVRS